MRTGDGAPAWTPDGRQVVFYSQRDGDPRIYRTSIDGPDGAPPEPISAPGEAALSPVPAPDGRLAFTTRRDDRWTIVSTRPNGSDPRLESDIARDYWAPAYDADSGRLLAHGPGPTDPASRFESDTPGAFRIHEPLEVAMPGRRVSLIGIRGYLPAVDSRVLVRGRPRRVHLLAGRELRALHHRVRRGRPAGRPGTPHPEPRPRHAPAVLARRRMGAVHVSARRR